MLEFKHKPIVIFYANSVALLLPHWPDASLHLQHTEHLLMPKYQYPNLTQIQEYIALLASSFMTVII